MGIVQPRSWFLLFPLGTTAWTTISQVRFGAQLEHIHMQMRGNHSAGVPPLRQLGYVWSLPEDATSANGLGGGITWAWDPALCGRLLPRFREGAMLVPFVTCDDLRASMHRGFASWADNHAHISFVDVTQECAAIDHLNATCPYAELWVTSLEPSADGDDALSEETDSSIQSALLSEGSGVEPSSTSALARLGTVRESQKGSSTAAATATPIATYDEAFRFTNGLVALNGQTTPVVATVRAVIRFNVDAGFCWYLDSTFCSAFHRLKLLATPDVVLNLGRLVIYGVWILVLLVLLIQLRTLLLPQCRTRGVAPSERCRIAIGAIAEWSTLGTAARLLLLVAPPIFFEEVFLPCFECCPCPGP